MTGKNLSTALFPGAFDHHSCPGGWRSCVETLCATTNNTGNARYAAVSAQPSGGTAPFQLSNLKSQSAFCAPKTGPSRFGIQRNDSSRRSSL